MSGGSLWVAVAAADRVPAPARESISEWASEVAATRPGIVPIVTCHRVENYGVGPLPEPPETVEVADRPALLHGEDAVAHLCRLAAGLESAMIGEDQVLHQIRVAFAEALGSGDPDPELVRSFEIALSVGRRARAGVHARRGDLGSLAIAWLDRTAGPLADRTLLIAGAGSMGRALATAASRRGARIIVASRTAEHAERLAGGLGGTAVDLVTAAELAGGADAIAIALGGPWLRLDQVERLPVTVDLSFPAVLTRDQQVRLGSRFAGVDTLFGLGRNGRAASSDSVTNGPAVDARTADDLAYAARAEVLVQEGIDQFAGWQAGRRSVDTLRRLRDRAEERRAGELDRLLRRLPDLAPPERDLVTAFSQQLVAGLLHDPTTALRDDADGSAADAVRHLFRL